MFLFLYDFSWDLAITKYNQSAVTLTRREVYGAQVADGFEIFQSKRKRLFQHSIYAILGA